MPGCHLRCMCHDCVPIKYPASFVKRFFAPSLDPICNPEFAMHRCRHLRSHGLRRYMLPWTGPASCAASCAETSPPPASDALWSASCPRAAWARPSGASTDACSGLSNTPPVACFCDCPCRLEKKKSCDAVHLEASVIICKYFIALILNPRTLEP